MPVPMTRRIHSSKVLGLVWATALATLASDTPDKHLICTHAGLLCLLSGSGFQQLMDSSSVACSRSAMAGAGKALHSRCHSPAELEPLVKGRGADPTVRGSAAAGDQALSLRVSVLSSKEAATHLVLLGEG